MNYIVYIALGQQLRLASPILWFLASFLVTGNVFCW
jgi:hypothetical protein